MIDDLGRVPTVGSLAAKIIRACPEHADCELTCPARQVEDLGEIASFDARAEPSIRQRFAAWLHSLQEKAP